MHLRMLKLIAIVVTLLLGWDGESPYKVNFVPYSSGEAGGWI